MSSPSAVAPPISEDLVGLRERLTQVDRELLDAAARRADCVRAIAACKARDGIPALDRAREAEHLEAMCAHGARAGLGRELVSALFTALFAASRAEQRRVLSRESERFRVGIVGATAGMGAFLARVLADAGFVVEGAGLGQGAAIDALAGESELVLLAVPIDVTGAVAASVGPRLRDGACLMDVTSVKVGPMAAMLGATRPAVDVVGTHPLFGPSERADLEGQRVVLCRGRGEAGFARVQRLFESLGAETVLADPAEHDAQMALVQGLVHVKTMAVGSTLARLAADAAVPLARASALETPSFRSELAVVARIFSQSAELCADLLTANPGAARVCDTFADEAALLAGHVREHDRAALLRRFAEVAAYLG